MLNINYKGRQKLWNFHATQISEWVCKGLVRNTGTAELDHWPHGHNTVGRQGRVGDSNLGQGPGGATGTLGQNNQVRSQLY